MGREQIKAARTVNRRNFLEFLISAPLTRSLPWKAIASIAPAHIAAQIYYSSDGVTWTFPDIISKTLRARAPEIAASVMANNALLAKMKEHGTVKPFTGGYVRMDIEEE